MRETVFLKLGGTLITNKDLAHTALIDQIDRIGIQIQRFCRENPDTYLLLGHGSGSFGHVAAKKFNTRQGVKSQQEWIGFSEVWREAHALDEIILHQFSQIGLPVISFPLSAAALTDNRQITDWTISPIKMALEHHLIPIIFGDVVFDNSLGGTILSTEEQMKYLVPFLNPSRILLAGQEPGVWHDFPACTKLIEQITPSTFPDIKKHVFGSSSTDVTGGMASKVAEMMELVQIFNGLKVMIFSGKADNSIYQALVGQSIGTVLTNQ